MRAGPYIIRISSQKGGVGKTTVAVNLSTGLSILNYKVLLVDADMSNPSVIFYLGLRMPEVSFKDVLLGKSKLEKADVLYKPTGMHVLPDSQTEQVEVEPSRFKVLGNQLRKTEFDFVIFDTSPGLIPENFVYYYYDEALLVSTPELPAIASVMKLAGIFNKDKIKHNLVINRFDKEIEIEDVTELYGKEPLAVFPEDGTVRESLAKQIPAYLAEKTAPFTKEMNSLVKYYSVAASKIIKY
jgi:MinD-like ATPase involved in chromosome partitioning or flagellar assembly